MPSTPIQTASLTLTRSHRGFDEVLILRRISDRAPFGGHTTFIAGKRRAADSQIPVDDPFMDLVDLRATALRECVEEVGLLWRPQGPQFIADLDARRAADHITPDAPLAVSQLRFHGWWKTPAWMDPAFDTAFFSLSLDDADQDLTDAISQGFDPDEFSDARWQPPHDVLDEWRAGRRLLTPPIRRLLLNLDHPDLAASPGLTPQSVHRPIGPLERIALPTETLPPATHTNAYLVGDHHFAVVDPGTDDPEALAPLITHIDARRSRGDLFQGILLTHHHGDHIAGVPPLAQRYGAPVAAHRLTLERLLFIDDLPQTVSLTDEQPIDLVDAPLIAHLTPGHAPGHLAFELPHVDAFIAGDLIASQGTILIDPPDGHMGRYLHSLIGLRHRQPTLLFPAHGDPITTPIERLDHYIDHRRHREDQVLQALRQQGPITAHRLVPFVYDDVPAHLWPLAARSLRAHLIHLAEQGLATANGHRYHAPL